MLNVFWLKNNFFLMYHCDVFPSQPKSKPRIHELYQDEPRSQCSHHLMG